MSKSAEERIAEAVQYLDGESTSYVSHGCATVLRLILQPLPKRHTFGGVVFEETGEVRPAKNGEWYKFGGGVGCNKWDQDTDHAFDIIRPVAIKEATDAPTS